jgi:hypothetical protein
VSEIEGLAAAQDLAFFRLNFSRVSTKRGFLRKTARILRFPSYFGGNWDAFEECLNDLEWLDAGGYVLLFDNLKAFGRKAPDEMETARSIFKDTAASWKESGIPFYVLLRV